MIWLFFEKPRGIESPTYKSRGSKRMTYVALAHNHENTPPWNALQEANICNDVC